MSLQKEEQLKSLKTKQGQYAEVMIIGPLGYAIGRLILDIFSNLLYSTKAEDYAAIEQLTKIGIKMGDAIDRLIGKQKSVTTNY
jgi:conjugal transfer ATP-binding protein TraC